jgi:hypothetical protein
MKVSQGRKQQPTPISELLAGHMMIGLNSTKVNGDHDKTIQ